MIRVTPAISIDESEIQEQFIRASGPGGQNVNKVATAVQLRFNVMQSPSLPEDVKRRLRLLAGSQVTDAGELVVTARRYRSQARNREDALDRLVTLLRRAAHRPKPRRKTKPSAASKQRRLTAKRQRGELKQSRRTVRRADQ